MSKTSKYFLIICIMLIVSIACGTLPASLPNDTPTNTPIPPTNTPLPALPVKVGEENPNEPVFITGKIPFTSPFFLDTISEAYVMLEDETGFILRDKEYIFPLNSQVLGPVELIDDETLTYQLALPAVPQGAMNDLDHDGEDDLGVQVFAIAYWSNTWGGPFLEPRDGRGWSSAYASTITDPDRDYEITGGILIVWAPDDGQEFPVGFGEDNKLFTDDDPVAPIPAGYNIVDLNETPFKFYKEAQPTINLIEGAVEVNDYSQMSYAEAFDALFEKVSIEYPFTKDKGIDWQALYDKFAPQFKNARDDSDFFEALHAFANAIPDAHIGIGFNQIVSQYFFENYGGSFGMVLSELSDGRVIISRVLPDTSADKAGLVPGTEIIQWNGKPIRVAIDEIQPFFGPYSTPHHKRLEQVVFLTRVPPGSQIEIVYRLPNSQNTDTASLNADIEYDSLFEAIPTFAQDILTLPIEAQILEQYNLAYIKISSFSDDYNLTAQLWDRYVNEIIDAEIDGMILDIRVNGGGNSGLAKDIAGYFYTEKKEISRRLYYNHELGEWEIKKPNASIEPGPQYLDMPVVVIVSPYCVSACEGFAYALSLQDNVTIIGHYPTAGAYGEVGRGQYNLPGDFSMQFPTGRTETPDGKLLIEGTGVIPDITIPLTEADAIGQSDSLLEKAISLLTD